MKWIFPISISITLNFNSASCVRLIIESSINLSATPFYIYRTAFMNTKRIIIVTKKRALISAHTHFIIYSTAYDKKGENTRL